MRSRSIRLSISIVLILAVAIAALGFKEINIDIPGFPQIERNGTGPLGLKLGLDLRGGGHLVYQADTGTKFEVTFAEPVSFGDLNAKLGELRFGDNDAALEDFQVAPVGENRFQIRAGIMANDDPRRTGLNEALAEAFGPISSFESSVIEEPTLDQMQGVLDNITRRVNRFGTEEPIIQIFGDDRIIVQLPGASGSVTTITFAEPVPDAEVEDTLQRLLAEAGYEEFKIDRGGESSFTVQSNTVNPTIQSAAAIAINDEIGAFSEFRVNSGIDEAKDLAIVLRAGALATVCATNLQRTTHLLDLLLKTINSEGRWCYISRVVFFMDVHGFSIDFSPGFSKFAKIAFLNANLGTWGM